MSGVIIIRYLLANNDTVRALVQGGSITAGHAPLDIDLPAIGIKQISGYPRHNLSMNGATTYVRERIQVTAYAKTYREQKTVLDAVRRALPVTHEVVNGITCEHVLMDTDGPDLYDDVANVYEQSVDYVVAYQR